MASWANTIVRALDNLAASNARRAAVAVLLAVGLFACGTFANVPSGTDDDYAFMLALSGRFPSAGDGLDGLCLFLNAGLCNLIYALSTSIPQVNWFVVLEVGISCLAFVVVVHVALGLPRREVGLMVIFGCILLIVRFCTYKNNFTDCAFMCTFAGGLLLLSRFAMRKRAVPSLLGGMALMAIGYAWRSDVFLLCLPFFGLTALWLGLRSNPQAPRQPARLVPFFLVLGLCAGLYAFNETSWSAPELQDWRAFNKVRSALVDYPVQPYDQIASQLEAIGVSENDYWMATHWMTEDPDFFTTQRMSQIAEIAGLDESMGEKAVHGLQHLGAFLAVHRRLLLFLGLLMVVTAATTKGADRLFCLGMLLGSFVLAWALLAMGRMPERVAYPLWIYAAGCCMAATFKPAVVEALPATARHRGKHAAQSAPMAQAPEERMPSNPLLASACALGVVAVSIMFAGYTAFHFDGRMAQATFDLDAFECSDPLVAYQQDSPDTLWFYDVHSFHHLEHAYLMRALPEREDIERMVLLGGWTSRSPFVSARNAQAGASDPIKALAERSDAVYIIRHPEFAERLLTYLHEHHFPDAAMETKQVPGTTLTACSFSAK